MALPRCHERKPTRNNETWWQRRPLAFIFAARAPRLQRSLILFAWATWVYRLVVFLGIAVLVYHFAFKLLGVFLFGVEIVWFVARPFWMEGQAWRARWSVIRASRRARRSAMLAAAVLAVLLLPWPGRVMVKGLLHPADVWPVFAPVGARVDALPYREGDTVPAGAELVRLYSPDLLKRQQAAQVRVEQLRWQAAASGFAAASRHQMLGHADARVTAQTEQASLATESLQYAPRAPFAGRLVDLDPDLRVGQWLARKERIAQLVRDGSPWVVETWLDEDQVHGVAVGDQAIFVTEGTEHLTLKLRVMSVDADASATLPRHELALQQGGHVLTRDKNGQLLPERAIYHVSLAPDPGTVLAPDLAARSWRGKLTIRSRWESPSWRYLRQALAVLIREFGF